MKNYIITEEQLKKIIEQVDGNTKKSSGIFGNLFGNEDKIEDEEDSTEDVDLEGNDPIQQFFNSLV